MAWAFYLDRFLNLEIKMKLPKVSFVISTHNCKDYLIRCLDSIKQQDYPENKIEIIVVDTYSNDGTIEAAKNFGAKIILMKNTGYMEGKGGTKHTGSTKARGDIIIIIDSDNKLVEKNWIRNMIYPLIYDDEVDYCVSPMVVMKNDTLINQYLSLIGTDPFAIYCSFDPQLTLPF